MSLVTPDVVTDEEVVMNTVETKEEEIMETTEVAEEEIMETETTEVAVTEEKSQEVSVASVTEKREGAIKTMLQDEAEAGFEGLEVGAFSFDRIKLSDGSFLLGDNETDIGNSFVFQIVSSRASYLVQQSDEEDCEIFYSYAADGSTKADGTSSKDITDKWLEEGFGSKDSPLVIKKYLEVMAILHDREDEWADAIVNLQIPPTSIQRLGGMSFLAKTRFKTNSGGVIMEASVGTKAGSGSKSFRPWNFKIIRKA